MTDVEKQVEMLREGIALWLANRYGNYRDFVPDTEHIEEPWKQIWFEAAGSLLHNLPIPLYIKVGAKFKSIGEQKK